MQSQDFIKQSLKLKILIDFTYIPSIVKAFGLMPQLQEQEL
jgi:hypothetical protein